MITKKEKRKNKFELFDRFNRENGKIKLKIKREFFSILKIADGIKMTCYTLMLLPIELSTGIHFHLSRKEQILDEH